MSIAVRYTLTLFNSHIYIQYPRVRRHLRIRFRSLIYTGILLIKHMRRKTEIIETGPPFRILDRSLNFINISLTSKHASVNCVVFRGCMQNIEF